MNMGENLKLFVVGPMENIFYAVPDVKAFSDADALLAHLADREGGR